MPFFSTILLFLTAITGITALTLPTFAGTSIISNRVVSAPHNPDCAQSGTCALKEIQFVEWKKRFDFPGEPNKYATYMTDIRFSYSVSNPSEIESYGVVQFIRGCMFHSRVLPDGSVSQSLSILRDHFGAKVTFQHKTWEVDSESTDPVYSSDPRGSRFSLLRWNHDPKSLDAEKANWYHDSKPPHGSVFIADLPGSAALTPTPDGKDGSARNVSLEFKTCLFRLGDLPRSTTPSGPNIDMKKALWCVRWDHKFVWNFQLSTMTTPILIDPICDVS